MFSSIQIRNFQSLQDIELELGHLTAIVGPTNVGKSAFIRAVTAAVNNRRGDSFIMDGTDFCRVGISDTGTTSVSWQKYRKKSGEYYLAGDKVIDESQFIKYTGLKTLSFAKGYFVCQPNFQQQKDDDFLLSASDQFKSRVLGEITNASLILLANTQIKKDSQKNSNALSFLEQERLEAAASLATKFVGLDDCIKQFYEVQTEIDRLQKLAYELEDLQELEGKLSSVIDEHNRALVMQQLLSKIVAPVLESTANSIKWINENTKFYDDLCRKEQSIAGEVVIAQKAVDTRKVIEQLPGLGNLEQQITDLHALMGYDEVVQELQVNLTQGDHDKAGAEQALFHLDSEIAEMKQQIDICPLCDTVLDKGHVHANSSNQ